MKVQGSAEMAPEDVREALAILCTCGGTLEEVLNFDSLAETVEGAFGPNSHIVTPFLCLPQEQERLRPLLQGNGTKKLVIAACSKNVLIPIIKPLLSGLGLGENEVEVVNIREQCAWVHPDRKRATLKAQFLITSAIEKTKFTEPVKIETYKSDERALVIGAGVAGIQASLDLAEQGLFVYLLERTPSIGGKMALLVKTYPTDDCAICILGPKMADVAANPNVQIITSAEVKEVKKTAGGFRLRVVKKPRYVDPKKCIACGLCAEKCPSKVPNEWDGGLGYRKAIYMPFPQALPRKYVIDPEHCLFFQKGVCRVCEKFCPRKAIDFEQEPEELELDVGSIVVATGFTEFDPSDIPRYGFGQCRNVITQFQLARILDPSGPTEGKLVTPQGGHKPNRVLMIQCVGSRDPEANEYCSRYCCMAALKNSMLIKNEQDPDTDITIVYKDVRAAGKGFEEYYARAKETYGIRFECCEVVGIDENEQTETLSVECETPEGGRKTLTADLVVLSCAMVPSEGTEELARMLGLQLGRDGFFKILDKKVSVVETKVPGICVCGCAEGPKDIPESVAQASAAASRSASRMSRELPKPLLISAIDEESCGTCGLCVKACPYGALSLQGEKVVLDHELCQGCGLCLSVCPSGCIRMVKNSDEQIRNQMRAIASHARAHDGSSSLISMFACEQCGYTLLDTVGALRMEYPPNIVPIFLPCASSLRTSQILEALSLGFDGVLVLGCPKDRCHYEKGVEIAKSRINLLKNFLSDLKISPESIRTLSFSGNGVHDFVAETQAFSKKVGG